MPLLTIGFIVWLLSSAAAAEVLVVAAILTIATTWYALRRWRTTARATPQTDVAD